MINENKLEGSLRDVGGKIQDAAGGLTGDSATQLSGKVNQVAGKAQRAVGVATDQAREYGDEIVELTKRNPIVALVAAGILGLLLGRWSSRR